ncbi:MAG: DUF3782 domain-containing protein [Magnetococcales bacterium]|nr:DUF3782 domain-containing protein [Magnetococcales bacterium]
MSTALTVDDVWKMFQETNRLFQESRREFQESQAEWRQQRQEMERARQEDRAETERVMRVIAEQSAASKAETERAFLETELQMRETDRKLKEVSTLVGNLGGRWGEFVEGLIAPACIAMFTERGLQVDEIFPRVRKTINGKRMEIDILVANTVDAVLVEVKSQLQVEDVRNHLTRLADFKPFFPRYANCRVYGAVAGIVVESEADQFAMKQGLFVIEQSGETVRLANDMGFKPKVW